MKFFIYTIFLSAFLLFQVQPMIARYILPWFGGSSAVWSTCLLFFQAGLLIGYGYAHLITRKFNIKNQIKIHFTLLLLSLLAIPIIPSEWMKPSGDDNPVVGILFLLSLTVGFPYIMVSTTGPLLQLWFSKANLKKSPYRLYALSNLGSMIGLLTYPVLIEPFLNLKTQIWSWSAGYIIFIVFCALTAKAVWSLKPVSVTPTIKKSSDVSATLKLIWLLLACMGTITLLSITNKLTQDIAVVPFLWIIPLTLYLISFIIAFDNPRWYNRKIFLVAMIITAGFIFRRQLQSVVLGMTTPLDTTVFLYCLGVFVICMVLHGELAKLKPDEGNLTLFYLIISAGGVFGGLFVNIIVPFIFNGYWEIYCSIAGSIILVAFILLRTKDALKTKTARFWISLSTSAAIIGIFFVFRKEHSAFNTKVIESSRNFYGVLLVSEADKGTTNWQRALFHGNTNHGIELMDPAYENIPITYYGIQSGIGIALSMYPTKADSNYSGMKVGMIGLGIGTISAFGTEKDLYRYYEIDPQVEIFARKYFKYLGNFKGKTEIVNGDGRISLERELKVNGSNQYDVLAVDAFSGDVIPTHLLTQEAMKLYFNHLKKDGILAFHITNRYLNLLPVMNGLSEVFKKPLHFIFQKGNSSGPVDAIWILFTDNKKFLNNPMVRKYIQPFDSNSNPKVYWTDDYSSILPLLN